VALLLSAIAPKLVEIILMLGGCYLCYEGAHKIIHRLRHDDHDHDAPSAELGPEAEAKTIAGAIRTDFILSTEIMVIALKEVLHEPLVSRGAILAVVAVGITVGVYGVVALIVKMDDIGLMLAERKSAGSQRLGRMLVAGMPKVLAWLSVIGTVAMLWVGGHILLGGAAELGWGAPYHLVHQMEHLVHGVPVVGGVLGWVVNTLISAIVGVIVGVILVLVIERLPLRRSKGEHGAAAPDGAAH
jgi:predicted DNA repair protein MutK